MKRIGVSFIFIIVVLSGSFHRISHNRTFRRCRAISFYYLIQELKSGDREEIRQVFHDGDYEIQVWGKHLPPISPTYGFAYPTAFLSIRVYAKGNPIGYFAIFPTPKGSSWTECFRKKNGKEVDIGDVATELISVAKESFILEGVYRGGQFDTIYKYKKFDIRTFEQLEAMLVYYYYEKNKEENPNGSRLEWFIKTVDDMASFTTAGFDKLARLLSLNFGNFAGFWKYAEIVREYSRKGGDFFSEMRKIKMRAWKEGWDRKEYLIKAQVQIVGVIGQWLPLETVKELLYASGLLSASDFLR